MMEIGHMLCVGRKKNLNFPVVVDIFRNYDHITLNWTHWTQKKPTTYDVVNPGPGLGQMQTCGGAKLINEIPNIPTW